VFVDNAGALSERFYRQVAASEVDPEATFDPDVFEKGEELSEGDQELFKIKQLKQNLRPEAPPCNCLSHNQGK